MGHFYSYVKWPEGIFKAFKGSRFGRLDANSFSTFRGMLSPVKKLSLLNRYHEGEKPPTHIVCIYIHIYIAYVPVCTYKMCYICYYHHYYGYPYFTMAILMIMHVSIHSKLCAICLNHLKSSDLGMKPPYYIGMYVLYIYIIHFSPTPRPAANARRLLLKISSKISTGWPACRSRSKRSKAWQLAYREKKCESHQSAGFPMGFAMGLSWGYNGQEWFRMVHVQWFL